MLLSAPRGLARGKARQLIKRRGNTRKRLKEGAYRSLDLIKGEKRGHHQGSGVTLKEG